MNTTTKKQKGAALQSRAAEVGMTISLPIHDGTVWVSGLEKWRSQSWVRKEINKRRVTMGN